MQQTVVRLLQGSVSGTAYRAEHGVETAYRAEHEGLDRPGDGRYGNYRQRPPAALLGLSVPYEQWRP
ncbi:hypothetical protein [Streptomyces sp. NRRL S-337]|uniref:hypothetical protein n=1 Tax=Streptomyces sp. NRRL S-337 TaxID=1463900 RepID=UPI00131A798E|nr:hypothetical protein [Streptomyces sp. NRRL S-337]